MISAPFILLVRTSITILTYLPNRDELLFLLVLEFPNASKIGLQFSIYY